MRRTEVVLILLALLGVVGSALWILQTRGGVRAERSTPAVASIAKLAPLQLGKGRETTDGAGLVSLGAMMPGPGYDVSGRIISKVNVNDKLIALTFDDGPSRKLNKILAMLDRYDARATFFIVSSYIAKHTSRVSDIVTQGSEVGNHTTTHLQLDEASADDIGKELDQAQEAIGQILGQKPILMRPPVGRYNEQVVEAARKRKLAVVVWSIHSQDTGPAEARELADGVVASASPGDIVLLHETGARTMEALPMILSRLKAKGYKFVTVSQLLGAGTPL